MAKTNRNLIDSLLEQARWATRNPATARQRTLTAMQQAAGYAPETAVGSDARVSARMQDQLWEEAEKLAKLNQWAGESFPSMGHAVFWLHVKGWCDVFRDEDGPAPRPGDCWEWTGPLRSGKPVVYLPDWYDSAVHAARHGYRLQHGPLPSHMRLTPIDTCELGQQCVNPDHWTLVDGTNLSERTHNADIRRLGEKYGIKLTLVTTVQHTTEPSDDSWMLVDPRFNLYSRSVVPVPDSIMPTHYLHLNGRASPLTGFGRLNPYTYSFIEGANRAAKRKSEHQWLPVLWIDGDYPVDGDAELGPIQLPILELSPGTDSPVTLRMLTKIR